MSYPTKTKQWGSYIWLDRCDDASIEEAKNLLHQQFEMTRESIERNGEKVFFKFHDDFQWITKVPVSSDPLNMGYLDPLCQRGTVGWKCTGTGRAFYIDRLGWVGRQYQRHPNKKCVPKRKRGKYNFNRYIEVMKTPKQGRRKK
jgi:hypothetical protein